MSTLLAEPADKSVFVKITFAINAKREEVWDGGVELEGGVIKEIQAWYFEPKDKLIAKSCTWKCKTLAKFERKLARRFAEPDKGVVLKVKANTEALFSVTTAEEDFSFSLKDLSASRTRQAGLKLGRPLAKLNGRARAEIAADSVRAVQSEGEDDYPSIAVDKSRNLWLAWMSHHNGNDDIYLTKFDGAKWSDRIRVSENSGDYYEPKTAVDHAGSVWVVWAANAKGDWDLYGRRLRRGKLSKTQRLTDAEGSDINHELIADAKGYLWLCWQSFRNANSDIFLKHCPNGEWSDDIQVTSHPANDWDPFIAADSKGIVYVAWDTYRNGNYDIYLKSYSDGEFSKPIAVTSSADFEAHANIVCDKQDRLWVAFDSAGPNWGKDYTRGETLKGKNYGEPLHSYRKLQLKCYANGKLYQASPDVPLRIPDSHVINVIYETPGPKRFYELPHLAIDASGRLWVFFRMNRQGYVGHPPGGALWEIYATCYDGEEWLAPIYVPNSRGRNDQRISTTLNGNGGLCFAYSRGSHFANINNDIYVGNLSLEGAEAKFPQLSPQKIAPPSKATEAIPLKDREHYAMTVAGKTYTLFWGDLHRHTDISLCTPTIGGTLLDAYRYAMDAELDFIGVTDHTRDVSPPYAWRRTQKAADFYYVPGTFIPFYSYERSNGIIGGGHRNVFFPIRDNAVYRSGPSPWKLWEQLKGKQSLTIPHTPGFNAKAKKGTWSYNDPNYETLAEIFQAYRASYELPKGAEKGQPKYKGASLWYALQKGYKLGGVASSDHWSTHLSYACVYGEQPTRQPIFDALKKRRTYGAMDKIILDLDMDGHVMGEEFKTRAVPKISVKAIGTAKIARADIIKNNRFVYTKSPMPGR